MAIGARLLFAMRQSICHHPLGGLPAVGIGGHIFFRPLHERRLTHLLFIDIPQTAVGIELASQRMLDQTGGDIDPAQPPRWVPAGENP